MNLYGIPPEQLEEVWETVAPLLAESVKYCDGKWTLADVKESIEKLDAQLFLVVDQGIKAAVVTQIHNYPSKRVLTILFLGGHDMREWLHLSSVLERWAKEAGCQAMEVWGRPGWERVLGWNKTSTVISKNIAR